MKVKPSVKELGVSLAGLLLGKAVENVPGIIDQMSKKKEEKNFFEENKKWIFTIIISIFVAKLDYINMFESVILNSLINMIFGIIVFVLLCLFYYEEKDIFKIKSLFFKTLIVSLFILGIINSFYHIGYAICCLITSII